MSREKELEAIVVISVALLILNLLFQIDVLAPISLGLMVISILSKFICSKLVWLWMKLGEGMGYVMSRIILSIIFFLFLFPLSVLYRFFNKDPLNLKRDSGDSNFTTRNYKYEAKDLKNPW